MKTDKKDFKNFSVMEDCIHLRACRRVQKIGRSLRLNCPRYCSEECSCYEARQTGEIIEAVSVDDVMHYIHSNAYLIEEGYDAYDVFAPQDLAPYVFDCIKIDEDDEDEGE